MSPIGPSPLHTDFLEKYYSAVSVDVIVQTETIRKAHLVDSLGVTRTYAITHLHPENWTEDIEKIAVQIKAGEAIGKTFRKKGYEIYKREHCLLPVTLSENLSERMKASKPRGIVRQYMFSASKDKRKPQAFATITEVYPHDIIELLYSDQELAFTPYGSAQFTDDFINEVSFIQHSS